MVLQLNLELFIFYYVLSTLSRTFAKKHIIPQKTHENHRKSGLFANSERHGTECGG